MVAPSRDLQAAADVADIVMAIRSGTTITKWRFDPLPYQRETIVLLSPQPDLAAPDQQHSIVTKASKPKVMTTKAMTPVEAMTKGSPLVRATPMRRAGRGTQRDYRLLSCSLVR